MAAWRDQSMPSIIRATTLLLWHGDPYLYGGVAIPRAKLVAQTYAGCVITGELQGSPSILQALLSQLDGGANWLWRQAALPLHYTSQNLSTLLVQARSKEYMQLRGILEGTFFPSLLTSCGITEARLSPQEIT